ncbi:hypothetical protein [Arenibacter echinorum]|nr:hypothetical protein [Arenibacter echinorum]
MKKVYLSCTVLLLIMDHGSKVIGGNLKQHSTGWVSFQWVLILWYKTIF